MLNPQQANTTFEQGANASGPQPDDPEEPPEDPLVVEQVQVPIERHPAPQRYLTRFAIAVGHALTGNLKPIGSYRTIYNPVTMGTESRARRNWLDRLL